MNNMKKMANIPDYLVIKPPCFDDRLFYHHLPYEEDFFLNILLNQFSVFNTTLLKCGRFIICIVIHLSYEQQNFIIKCQT